MVDQAVVAELADRLWSAQVDRATIAPISTTLPHLTIDDAYAVQAHNIERRAAAGAVVHGHKVGQTSRRIQEFLGIDEPASGVVLDEMLVDANEEIPAGTVRQPRVEAGMALVLGRDLAGPRVTTRVALAAIAGVLPVIDVMDSRIVDWRITAVDAVADNASGSKVVLGTTPTPTTGLDLRLVGMVLVRNGVVIDSGAGAAAMGHPARSVAWLANRLASSGGRLREGDVVLSGALHRLVPARPGDVFRAEFAHLGAVTAVFAGERAA